uniref:Histone H2A C-terminal domain-containing protein n=1 Tax=Meloidogyne floridensis TaxID=298350 RepID=A0A915P8V6_9BILA
MLNTSSTTTANASLPTMQGPTEKLKYPLVCVTPFGTISITMAHNVNIEISLDRSIRVVCWNKFAISSTHKGSKSGILHPFGHILQEEDKVFYPGNDSNLETPTKSGIGLPKPNTDTNWIRSNLSNHPKVPADFMVGNIGMPLINDNGLVNTQEGSVVNLAKMAILGTQGVLFSMSHLKDAFLVSAAAARGTSALSMDRIQFPSLRYDYTLRQFYVDSQVFGSYNDSAEYLPKVYACDDIVHRARYEEKSGMLFSVSINGFLIRQKLDGDVEVFCRPRQIVCSPSQSTIHLRGSNVEMEVQSDEKAYVKCGAKRVHVSRSGMVVSDGNCTTSMDHIGLVPSQTKPLFSFFGATTFLLIMPPASKKVRANAVFLEYLVSEIIDGAGNIAKRDKRLQITPRHLFLAIKEDNELKEISEHVTIVQGGVVPGILNELLPPPKKKVAAVNTPPKPPPKPSKPQQKKPKEKMSSTKKKNVRQGSVSRNEPQQSLEDIGEENDC